MQPPGRGRYNCGMNHGKTDALTVHDCPSLPGATLVLAFTGWMDGGDVSTGTVKRLVDLLAAQPVAEIDPEAFYLYNFPGPMDLAALFRPAVAIEDGLVQSVEMPANTFYCHEPAQLILFVGKEPNCCASSATASWRSPGGSACAGCCSSARSEARRRTRESRGCT